MLRWIFPHIETIILTVTNVCNLNCIYCHNRPYLSRFPNGRCLSLDDFRDICYQYGAYLVSCNRKEGEFCFSGGEPLIIGKEYYQNIVRIEEEVSRRFSRRVRFKNLIQTNGTLIDKEWGRFISKYGIKIGISIDGPQIINSITRRSKALTNGAFSNLERSIEILHKSKAEFGFLTVVSRYNKNNARAVVDWLISKSPSSIAFIPCLDYDGKVDALDYGNFLIDAFDRWVEIKRFDIPVRNFKFVISHLLGIRNIDLPCENGGRCPVTINVNLNKDVFICDVFMGKRKGYLGNLGETTLRDLSRSLRYIMVRKKVLSLPDDCLKCRFVRICNGGCFYRRDNPQRKDYLCRANIRLFEHIERFMLGSSGLKKTPASPIV